MVSFVAVFFVGFVAGAVGGFIWGRRAEHDETHSAMLLASQYRKQAYELLDHLAQLELQLQVDDKLQGDEKWKM
ncbi:MAG: hypothetical protein JW704_09815 [Anaerolineaceae bacterium]|nr:hypothetical protein [Anaerolineaceae bacterium]